MHADDIDDAKAKANDLAERIAETAAMLDATTHRLLTDIRVFDECGGWHRQGARSCAHWLNWRIGVAPNAAREKVRVARALGTLPHIDDALRLGQVSYSKVRAMTRVASPDTEVALLDMARYSTGSQLEKICRLYRQVGDDAVKARADEDRRWVRSRNTDDGLVRLDILLPPDEAERVLKAMDVSAETSNSDAAFDRADGLLAMADAVLRGDAPDRSPVDITLHVDAATLQGHLPDGTGVSAQTARRLCCDAGIAPVIEDADGKTLDVGRKTRSLPAAIRRAMAIRDGGCRFPGCTHRRFVDGHHIVHWADGGHTKLENVCSLCTMHHRYVHEYGYTVECGDDGEFVFRDPGGAAIPAAGAPRAAVYDVGARMAKRLDELAFTRETNMPRWDGTEPDYDLVVSALLHTAAAAAAAVPA